MSNQPSRNPTRSGYTFQSASYSYSSSSINGATAQRTEAAYSDPSGTKVYRKSQNFGEAAPREERLEYDNRGRELRDAGTRVGAIEDGRIEDVTEEEERKERDRKFAERMGDEYAKREGGA